MPATISVPVLAAIPVPVAPTTVIQSSSSPVPVTPLAASVEASTLSPIVVVPEIDATLNQLLETLKQMGRLAQPVATREILARA